MEQDQLNGYEQHRVRSLQQLEQLYEEAPATSLLKEIDYISDHYRAFIEKSPFVVVASVGPDGLDCSPRGDPAGFVRVHDKHTVLMPDRRGNNRLDSIRNLIVDPRASLLFLIPGVGNTLRINGRGYVLTEPALIESFAIKGKLPKTVLMFKVDRIYFQCPKALVRSRLWDPSAQIERSELPSTGEILQALKADFDGEAYDQNYPQHLKRTIY